MPGAAGSALLMMFTWAERLAGDATVATQPRSIATSKPSRSTKKSRVSAGRSDLMLGTALLTVTVPVLSHDRATKSVEPRRYGRPYLRPRGARVERGGRDSENRAR